MLILYGFFEELLHLLGGVLAQRIAFFSLVAAHVCSSQRHIDEMRHDDSFH